MITKTKPTPGLEKSGDFVLTTPLTASNKSLTAISDELADPSETSGCELEFVEQPINYLSDPPPQKMTLDQKTGASLTQSKTSISSHTNPGEATPPQLGASRSAKGLGKRSANGGYLGFKGYSMWSAFNPIWGSYRVVQARLSRASDRENDWVGTVGRPDELRLFLGSGNPVNRSTMTWLEQCLKGDIEMGSFLLHRPAGCGKSTLVKELTATSKTLTNRVKTFFAANKDPLHDIFPRFVVVDGLERVPSQAQQALFSLVEIATAAEEGKASRGGAGREGSSARLRLVLTTREPSKVILALRKSVKLLEVQTVDLADGMRILLRILQHENVGYEILAVKTLFQNFWPDLRRCIAVSQQVFCDEHYLSEVNVLKVVDPKGLREYNGKARRIKPWDSLEPLGRCPTCTLRPTCCHISEQELIARGIQRRAELPQRRLHGGDRTDVAGDSIDCERFVKQGACRIFNELGRCNFHHPLDVHTVEIPPQRCPQCTIRLPCNHCDHNRMRTGSRALSAPLDLLQFQNRQKKASQY